MAPPVDPAAPHGYNLDGSPRKSRAGRKPGSKTSRPADKPAGAPAPPRKPATARGPAAKRKNYAGIIEAGLTLSLNLTKIPAVQPYNADIAVIYLERKALAQAGNEGVHKLVNRYPKLQDVIDKLSKFGPGVVVGGSTLLGTFAQIAHNHGWLPAPAVQLFKPISREEIQRRMETDMLEQMRAAGIDPNQMRPVPQDPPRGEPGDAFDSPFYTDQHAHAG